MIQKNCKIHSKNPKFKNFENLREIQKREEKLKGDNFKKLAKMEKFVFFLDLKKSY